MEKLPDLVLIRAFKLLPLSNQLYARLVCKRWKTLIEERLLRTKTELVILIGVEERPLFWSRNHRTVDLNNSISVDLNKIQNVRHTHKILKWPWLMRYFKNVKSLFISLFRGEFNAINDFVNLFSKLEHLEVCNPCIGLAGTRILETKVNLRLRRLQTLHWDCNTEFARLNCPSLSSLSTLGDFRMQNKLRAIANKLQFLKAYSFYHQPDWVLPNLEVLYFSVCLQIDIEAFPKLKEIHYHYHPNFDGSRGPRKWDLVPKIKETLCLLFEKKVCLGKELDLYYDGMNCRSVQQIQAISTRDVVRHLLLKEELELLLQNSSELKLENARKTFCFNDATLYHYVVDRLGDECIERLARSIEHVWMDNKPSEGEPLYMVHKNLSFPLDLKVRPLLKYVINADFGRLPQKLLDSLPDLMPSLLHLQIFFRDPHGKILNFFFISRFKGLQQLMMSNYSWNYKSHTSIDLLRSIIHNCRHLNKIIIRKISIRSDIFIKLETESQFRIIFVTVSVLPHKNVCMSSWTEVLDYLEQNGEIKSHFFSDFFNENYHLDVEYLNTIDYFYCQSH